MYLDYQLKTQKTQEIQLVVGVNNKFIRII